MATQPKWQYDEFKIAGLDYCEPAVVERYDAQRAKLELPEDEKKRILAKLNLGRDQTLLDMGAGTGNFAIYAAQFCRRVFAVDVSQAMLARAREKASKAGADNIEFHRGGFLTYEHHSDRVDAILSIAALHHLPDYWKFIALERLAGMLKPGGRIFLMDVVFSSEIGNYAEFFDKFVADFCSLLGEDFAEEVILHLREEYSTFDWVMDGLFARAGFTILERVSRDGCLANYLCEKSD